MSNDTASAMALQRHLQTQATNRAVEHLMGLVQGMVADRVLQPMEVQYLSTWLGENSLATATWPGSLIARKVREILADGVVTEAEAAYLLQTLEALVGNDFGATGSASPEVSALPINDVVTVRLVNASVCHTGEFLYGTRAAVERATLARGGVCADSPTRRVQYLVVGTRVSPSWAHTSFGRKIQRAVELQEAGHEIEIISERRWMEALD